MKIKNNIPINGSLKKLARQDKNLTLFLGDNQAARQFAIENSVCCGLGRQRVNWINNKGVHTKITYPHTFSDFGIGGDFAFLNNVTVNNKQDLAKFLTSFLNFLTMFNTMFNNNFSLVGGFIVLVDSCNCFYVLGANHLKNEKGQLLNLGLKKTFPEAISLDFSKIIENGVLKDNV
jgi:hypothetical protein